MVDDRRFLPGLHGLRAIAAIAVVLFHQAPNLEVPGFADVVKTHGGLGVQLFFVLSAFSLAHSTHPRLSDRDWIASYAVKRFFRIAPLFYAALLFFAIYDYFVWGKIYSVADMLSNILFVYNLIPGKHESIVWAGWTIGVEVVFYLIFPLILSVTKGLRFSVALFVFSCAISPLVAFQLAESPGVPSSYGYMNLLRSMPSFSAGLLAYFFYRAVIDARLSNLTVQIVGATATTVFLFFAVNLPFDPVLRPDLWMWSLVFASLCVWQAVTPGWLLASRPMLFAGERSYSVYLVHAVIVFRLMPVWGAIYAAFPGSGVVPYLISVAFGLACVLTVANLTYEFIEQPFIRLGNRLLRRSSEATTERPSREGSIDRTSPA